MEKGFKELYSFSVDREVEKEVSSTKKDKKTGEEITVTKKVKEKEPLAVKIKKPSRRELEDAELEFSVEMSKCIKKGILTKAMLAKKYSDTGGLMSEDDAQELVDNYKKIFELQSDYSRLEIIQNKTEKQTKRVDEIIEELQAVSRKIVENINSVRRDLILSQTNIRQLAPIFSQLEDINKKAKELELPATEDPSHTLNTTK
jgi:small-conductance mechanosensitive channel